MIELLTFSLHAANFENTPILQLHKTQAIMQLLTVFISSAIFMSRIFSWPQERSSRWSRTYHVTTYWLSEKRSTRSSWPLTEGRMPTGQIGVRRRITFLGVALAMPLQLFLSRSIAASRRVRRDVTTTGGWRHQIYRTQRWHIWASNRRYVVRERTGYVGRARLQAVMKQWRERGAENELKYNVA